MGSIRFILLSCYLLLKLTLQVSIEQIDIDTEIKPASILASAGTSFRTDLAMLSDKNLESMVLIKPDISGNAWIKAKLDGPRYVYEVIYYSKDLKEKINSSDIQVDANLNGSHNKSCSMLSNSEIGARFLCKTYAEEIILHEETKELTITELLLTGKEIKIYETDVGVRKASTKSALYSQKARLSVDKDLETVTSASAENRSNISIRYELYNVEHIDKIKIFARFHTNWYNNKTCYKKVGQDEKCTSYLMDTRILVRNKGTVVKECGPVISNNRLERSDQVYLIYCNARGDEIVLTRIGIRLVLAEIIITAVGCGNANPEWYKGGMVMSYEALPIRVGSTLNFSCPNLHQRQTVKCIKNDTFSAERPCMPYGKRDMFRLRYHLHRRQGRPKNRRK